VLPNFTWELDTESIETLADLAVEYEYIDALPDFERLLQQQ